jgi:hypothetical protein
LKRAIWLAEGPDDDAEGTVVEEDFSFFLEGSEVEGTVVSFEAFVEEALFVSDAFRLVPAYKMKSKRQLDGGLMVLEQKHDDLPFDHHHSKRLPWYQCDDEHETLLLVFSYPTELAFFDLSASKCSCCI